ncbi:MAG: LemA family protein [Planctomycetota bacterium]|jgi:hypothetical protein
MESIKPIAVMGVIALFCLVVTIRSLRRRRLHLDVPTSKTKGVFLGLNEVKGTCRCEQPLASRLAGAHCVWFAWSVEEEWEREVTETDSEGKTTTRTESGWETVADGGDSIAFELEDDTGRIRVLPDGAEIDPINSFHKTCGSSHALYYEHAPQAAISDSTGQRRLSETILPVDAKLYVIGTARMRADVVEPEIAEAEHGEIFMISTESEQEILRGHFWAVLLGTLVGAGLAGGIGWTLRELPGAAAGAGSFLGALAMVWTVLVYNGLVSVRQRVEMSDAMLDVQLKRRHVLLPRLQACVAAIAGHERSTHERVAALRSAGELIALAEDYPDLKSDRKFRHLQDELVETEDRIALARAFFNNSVTAYNTRVEQLPAAIVARVTGFRRRELLASA